MILGSGRVVNGGMLDRSTPNNKLVPPTHVTYHRSVGASMQSIMTDITNEDEGGMRLSQRHLAAIDTSKEPSYEQDYDNMSFKGYVQEIEERGEEQQLKKEQSQFTLKSTPSQLQILEEVEIDNTPDPSQSKIEEEEEEEEVKTIDDNIKTSAMISPESKRQQKQPQLIPAGECDDPLVEKGSPNDMGGFFNMGNFFGRRRHNHYSSEPSSPPRPLCSANQRQISAPTNLQSKNDNSYTRMLEEEVIRLKLELAYAQSQSDQHQMALNKLTEERDSLKSSNTQLSLLNNELSQTNATQMVQISGLQQHKDIIIQKCDKFSEEFVKCQTALKVLSAENENLKKKSNEQDVVIFYLQENIEKANKEKDELRVANQQLSSDNTNNNNNAASMDWQQQQQQQQQPSNSINESMNSTTTAPPIFSSNKPSHVVQMELKELTMKNQYLQQENKQLKELIHQDSDPDLGNINTSTAKRRTSSINVASQRSLESTNDRNSLFNNANSYHTVISNTIQEVEKFSITQQQHHHNNCDTSPSISKRASFGRTRSGTFNTNNLYSYNASPASHALQASIER